MGDDAEREKRKHSRLCHRPRLQRDSCSPDCPRMENGWHTVPPNQVEKKSMSRISRVARADGRYRRREERFHRGVVTASEIWFTATDLTMYSATVNLKSEEFEISPLHSLFPLTYTSPLGTPYDVSPDAQRIHPEHNSGHNSNPARAGHELDGRTEAVRRMFRGQHCDL